MTLIKIHNKIHEIRGLKVMLDFDLANLYEVETRVLKQAVRRNMERFPEDFMFQLTNDEWSKLITICDNLPENAKFSPAAPYVFTEQGVAMLSGVLKSKKAIEVNISIMRAFVQLRQFALNYSELAEEIRRLESEMNKKFADVYQALDYLINEKKKQLEQENRKKIGYKTNHSKTGE